MKNSKPILLVEDDRIDAMIFERAVKELGISNQLVHCCNGEEALDYLRGNGSQSACVIFLDLNMPTMSGFEFLKIVKSDESLSTIPVIALTGSANSDDTVESFKSGVCGYIVKPADYKNFVEAIEIIDSYWTLSELPN